MPRLKRLCWRMFRSPSRGAGEVLVKVAFCGICHSDLSLINGTFPTQLPVVTQGHEASGTIAKLGPGVTGWAEGDRVIVAAGRPCQKCPNCRRGDVVNCLTNPVDGLRLRRRVGRIHGGTGGGPDAGTGQRRAGTGRHPGRRGVDALRCRGPNRKGRGRGIRRGVGCRRGGHPHRSTLAVGRRGAGDRRRPEPGRSGTSP